MYFQVSKSSLNHCCHQSLVLDGIAGETSPFLRSSWVISMLDLQSWGKLSEIWPKIVFCFVLFCQLKFSTFCSWSKSVFLLLSGSCFHHDSCCIISRDNHITQILWKLTYCFVLSNSAWLTLCSLIQFLRSFAEYCWDNWAYLPKSPSFVTRQYNHFPLSQSHSKNNGPTHK